MSSPLRTIARRKKALVTKKVRRRIRGLNKHLAEAHAQGPKVEKADAAGS